jgi:hypothetical protein
MFRRGSIAGRILLALIILGGVLMAGRMAYRAGYARGAATADAEVTQSSPFPTPPAFLTRMSQHGRFFPFRWMGTLFCGGILFLMACAALLCPPFRQRLLIPMMPQHHGWPGHPWCECDEAPVDETVEKAEKR